jgi:hypothetical protein
MLKFINEMFKSVQPFIVKCLHKFYNAVLLSGYYPKKWCESFIVPIFKFDNPRLPQNYRGIAVSNCFGRILNIAFLKSTKHTYSFLWLPLIYLSIRHFSTTKWSDVRAFLEKPIWLSWIKLFSSRKLSSLLFSIIFKILPNQFDTAMPR